AVDKKKKQQERRAKQNAAQDFHTPIAEFRALLLSGRKEYSKGRAYDAVELQTQALTLGAAKIPRFNDDSLVKAHALMELGLAKSAIQTDFASGEEWKRVRQEGRQIFSEALEIYENRVAKGTLTKFRKEECWIDGSKYVSPVPHTERLGPCDYLQCLSFVGLEDPSPDTVRSIKLAMDFVVKFEASGHVIGLECGGALEGMLAGGEMEKLAGFLREHEAVIQGHKSKGDAMDNLFPDNECEELRHTGSLMGKMKLSHKKLAKDADKIGYKQCENHACENLESQPGQFSTCSKCKWAAYCCRDCQVGDWKRHKKECKSGEAVMKAQAEKTQNKMKNCLMVGQSQQVLVIISYLHHFAAISKELKETNTEDASRAILMVTPKFKGLELGTMQLGVQDVGLVWNAIWSMERRQRNRMFGKFVEKMGAYNFPKGGPVFTVVTEWGLHGVSGNFAVVKHTKKGTILLHKDSETDDVKGYLAVGITQSIESLLSSVQDPMPIYVNTALIPFKKMVLCQGTIGRARGVVSNKLQDVAQAFVNGDPGGIKIVEIM
ncbi:hypothetical protein ACHAXR_005856, partial [Thalassiosira sp. AJA248-18]